MGGRDPRAGGDSLSDAGRWRVLALLAVAEVLGMSLWFSASAVAGQYRALWGLTPGEAAWLTTVVQLGFVVGTAGAALLNLADVLPSRWYFAGSALLGAAANAALIGAGGYGDALVLRFLTGLCLAGVYPPGMRLMATWCKEDRGLGIGLLVGALTFGSGMPHLLNAVPILGAGDGGGNVTGGMPPWRTVLIAASILAAAGGLVALLGLGTLVQAGNPALLIIGVVLALPALLLFPNRISRSYVLMLATAAGEVQATHSADADAIAELREAIESRIARSSP